MPVWINASICGHHAWMVAGLDGRGESVQFGDVAVGVALAESP
jgi:hypothetical protein